MTSPFHPAAAACRRTTHEGEQPMVIYRCVGVASLVTLMAAHRELELAERPRSSVRPAASGPATNEPARARDDEADEPAAALHGD
jgi:hypothetical protein